MTDRNIKLTECAKFSMPEASSCIICQRNSQETSSSENGRKRVREAAEIRNNCVLKRLKLIGDKCVYHMNNGCYKKYTLRKSLEKVKGKGLESLNKEKLGAQAKAKSVCHVPSKRVTSAHSIKETAMSVKKNKMCDLRGNQKSGYLSEISNI